MAFFDVIRDLLVDEGVKVIGKKIIDIIADNGVKIGLGYVAGAAAENGTAATVTGLVTEKAGETVGTGIALGTIEVGGAATVIGPALGISAGIALYKIAPEFWTELSERLFNGGKTIDNRVINYYNGDGYTFYDADTINIFKNCMADYDLFKYGFDKEDSLLYLEKYMTTATTINNGILHSDMMIAYKDFLKTQWGKYESSDEFLNEGLNLLYSLLENIDSKFSNSPDRLRFIRLEQKFYNLNNTHYFPQIIFREVVNGSNLKINVTTSGQYIDALQPIINSSSSLQVDMYYIRPEYHTPPWTPSSSLRPYYIEFQSFPGYWLFYDHSSLIQRNYSYGTLLQYVWNYTEEKASNVYPNGTAPGSVTGYWALGKVYENDAILPDATLPNSTDSVQTTYPNWVVTIDDNEYFPIPTPQQIPHSENQKDSQNVNIYPSYPAVEDYLQNDTDTNPTKQPVNQDADGNPSNPNIIPNGSAIIWNDDFEPAKSNGLFTVYNITDNAQIRALGNKIWNTNIISTLRNIWTNDPLEGIISFFRLPYDVPFSDGANIVLGLYDTEVLSYLVAGQYTTLVMGSMDINPYYNNATDISPYTQVHLFLPFIGFTELDMGEIIDSKLTIQYTIDNYTGACTAQIWIEQQNDSSKRPDIPEKRMLYSLDGNMAMQIPITANSFRPMIQNAIGLIGNSIGAVNNFAMGKDMNGVGSIVNGVENITNSMNSVSRGGNFSGNIGYLNPLTPYIIYSRVRSYDANAYNALYGYPSNKTVILNTCVGFTAFKDVQLKISCTDIEKDEIETLLKNGVYFQ